MGAKKGLDSSLESPADSRADTMLSGSLGDQLAVGRRDADTVDRLARDLARERASSQLFDQPRPTVAIGRYVVLEKIGSGAMGVVYAAYDPELDRKVAVKVLRPRAHSGAMGDHARLQREARALAKLTHPNVVGVYDVGTVEREADGDSSVFIAMEYVDGTTLAEWLAAAPRSVAAIVAVMVDAGRGLAAAHASGLVHRDFKPDNVMIGRDGRVRVMDFGLARAAVGVTLCEVASGGEVTETASDASMLAQTGGAAGTPAYMAPEQFVGDEVGPACDQFGFCVTLWEALHGRRPFSGSSVPQLWAALREGRVLPAASPREIPKWLRDAVARGLAFEPDDRWNTIDDLLRTLERGRSRARARRAIVAAGVLASFAAGALGLRALERREAVASCRSRGEEVAELWPAHADTVNAALRGTGVSTAETTLARVQPWLDEWAEAWTEARTEACVRHDVDGTLSSDHHRRALGCLDVQVAGMQAVIDELEAGGRGVVYRGAKFTTRAIDPHDCLDALRLGRGDWPDDADWDATLDLRRRLAALGAREEGNDGALSEARAILAGAEALGWTPLVVEARVRFALLLSIHGDYERAEAELREAYFAAGGVGADELALHAAVQLSYLLVERLARTDDGLEWVRHSEMLLERVGDREPAAAAALLSVRGDVLTRNADYDGALGMYRRALEIRQRELTPDHPEVADTLNVIATAEAHRGRHREAKALYEEAIAMLERALGPDHPDLAHPLNNLANMHVGQRSYDEAALLYERAIAIWERSLGPTHPRVAAPLGNLAATHFSRRQFDRAQPLYERALAIKEATLGDGHVDLVLTLVGLCNTQCELGALDDALATCERGLRIAERSQAPDHRVLVAAMKALANVQGARGDIEGALRTTERALAMLEAKLGSEHPDVATMLHQLAAHHVARGDQEQGLALRERALAIREKVLGPDDPNVASSIEWVAESHRALGRNDEAERLYERALSIRERTQGPEHREVADALIAMGEIAIALGRRTDGIQRLERALAIMRQVDAPAPDRAHAEAVLARALAEDD